MRIIVFFDLPTIEEGDLKEYRKFRKLLLNKGFIMMQESVYTRMALNRTTADYVLSNLRKNKPPKGLVQILVVTEKQFQRMEFLTGEFESDMIDNDERIIFLW